MKKILGILGLPHVHYPRAEPRNVGKMKLNVMKASILSPWYMAQSS